MDVNGTRFHLIQGASDWAACREVGGSHDGEAAFCAAGALTLRPVLALFRPERPGMPLAPEARRGAGVDRFGNWYWIGHDQRSLYTSTPGGRARLFWSPAASACPAPGFRPLDLPSLPVQLAGLAVTEHHYLVVGDVGRAGLLVFDLHSGGEPLLLRVPAPIAFAPFDLAPAPGGGVWVLDRVHRAYWGFDRRFRAISNPALLRTVAPAAASPFGPLGGPPLEWPEQRFPDGFALAVHDPIAIEGLPDGSVLVLSAPATTAQESRLARYLLGAQQGPDLPLRLVGDIERSGSLIPAADLPLVGHDIAYLPGLRRLVVADQIGKQALAFTLDTDEAQLRLTLSSDYLPLHAFGGRALVAADPDHVAYDLGGRDPARDDLVRWTTLRALEQPRYQTEATVLLGATATPTDAPPRFDGKERACVWHRIFLDGCIPPEATVEVWTRAADSPDLLESMPFLPEPQPYLRGSGPELPFYRPPEEQGGAGQGTWELLIQAARGRFLQVRLVLRGNGRVTPLLRRVRIYYPRFSYLRRYLPAVYQDDRESAAFVERLLANTEGFYSEIEGKMTSVGALFDPRSAPPEALEWLAGWWGLMFDPLWARLKLGHTSTTDRRRLFIRFARRLYDRRGTVEGIRFALHLLLDPCLEESLAALKRAAVRPSPALRDTLANLGLPQPTPVMSDADLEDLLYGYMLAPDRPSRVRIVERFATRGGRGLVAGDPTASSTALADEAHTFSVLIPEDLAPEEAAMVERIVRLEKPAHTNFDIRRYFDAFRIGEARLGIDTTIGEDSRFRAIVLGEAILAAGYLTPAPPMGTTERMIADRDRLGTLPAL